ncbi:hypothetical protein IC006_2819 [Sulfuracidifex tepidarius]|uniref:SSD domain-containing protein n=1 Tax=Sulfuracidifex tepidarius TaxID=1294262 RepID=A0A510DZ07_9CREN|nr:MMPL family transporter [Sulfuracidifex tepidarius]BBG25483.1 hypothetical protein IC006_2819 [Sulfuracidifex tepidarius]
MHAKARVLIWVIVISLSLVLASQSSNHLSYNQNYTLPSYFQSVKAQDLLNKNFPSGSANNSIDIALINATPFDNYIVSQKILQVKGVENATSVANVYIDYATALGKIANQTGDLLNDSAYALYYFPSHFIKYYIESNNSQTSLLKASKGLPEEVKVSNYTVNFTEFYSSFAKLFVTEYKSTGNVTLSYTLAFKGSLKNVNPIGLVALKYLNSSDYTNISSIAASVSKETGISEKDVCFLIFKPINANDPLLYEVITPPSSLISQYVAHNVSVVFVYTSYSPGFSFKNGTYPDGIISNEVQSAIGSVFHGKFYVTGTAPIIQELSSSEGSRQGTTFALVFIALLVVIGIYFRSIVAPLISLSLIALSVLMGFGVISIVGILKGSVNFEIVEPLISVIMGIGADYSVFLMSRFKEELQNGKSSAEAMSISVSTSGRAILISGTAVTAVFSSFVFVPYLRTWGLVITPTIPLTLLIAVTLLPLIYMKLGKRTFWPSHVKAKSSNKVIEKVSRFSLRHSNGILVGVLIVGIAASLFVLSIPMNFNDTSALPDYPAVQGLNVIDDAFGHSFINPILIVIHSNYNFNTSFLMRISNLENNISHMKGVKQVFGPVPSNFNGTYNQEVRELMKENIGTDNKTALITVIMNYPSDSKQAFSLVSNIEKEVSNIGYIGGTTSTYMDLESYLMPYYEGIVIALPLVLFVVLSLFMRSFRIGLGMILTIILTIVSSLSIVYIAYGINTSTGVIFFIPLIVYVLMMGLGSDYSVFILSRIREEEKKGSESIIRGITLSAGAVTALGVILAASFGVLVTDPISIISELGAAIALAALIDTFIIRLSVYPAILSKIIKSKIKSKE